MFKYRLPSRTQLFRRSLEWELRKIRRQVTESRDEGYRGLVARAMEAFRIFITSLGEPRFQFEPIFPGNNTASLDYYNKTRKTIQHDLVSAEEDVSNLGYAAIESFNVASILAKELEVVAAQAGGKANDLALISRDSNVNLLVAGDDFTNKNLVNDSFPLTLSPAFVDTRQGYVSLARTQSSSAIDFENTEIEVKPITPGISNQPSSYADNIGRFYEGRFYALAGQAEPEGGRWHLEELTSAPPDRGYYYTHEVLHNYNGYRYLAEYEYNGNEESVNPIGAYVDDDGEIVIRNEIIIRDRGATEAEKNEVRKRMIDGNPDTYWQCEYVLRPSNFGNTPPQLQGRDIGAFQGKKRGYDPNNINRTGQYTPGTRTDLRGTHPEGGGLSDARLQITPEDLRVAAASYDNMDLDITITLRLPNPVPINWIQLNPMNFGETSWLNVKKIEVAERRNGIFYTLPNFSNSYSQNILTEDVNSEVLSEIAEQTLAPSRFSYRGQGIWTFPTREVQVVRFTISQATPTPVLYQKIRLQMHRIWERLDVQTYDSSSRSLRSQRTDRAEWTRVITLRYLQSVQILQGALEASNVAPTTEGDPSITRSGGKDMSTDNFFDTTLGTVLSWPLGGVLKSLGLGGGHNRSSTFNTNSEDSGWYMKGYWVETFYDLIAYRIGIRDLGLFRNVYETSSELVSSPFYSPVDIKQVTLRVDDETPASTSIEYYVSPNEGETWHRLNPLDKPSIYGDDGFAVPKTISFNVPGNPGNEDKYISTEFPVRKLLFRAVLRSTNSSNSPILRTYKIIMYPADNYRPQEFEI